MRSEVDVFEREGSQNAMKVHMLCSNRNTNVGGLKKPARVASSERLSDRNGPYSCHVPKGRIKKCMVCEVSTNRRISSRRTRIQ